MTEKYFRTEKTNCLRDLKRQIYLKATSFLIKSWKWYFLFFGAQKNNIIAWKLFLSNFFNLILAGNTDQNGYIRNTVQKKKWFSEASSEGLSGICGTIILFSYSYGSWSVS